ncbi:MAG: mechanosensitive ion channel family protein [Thermaceae bacterium]
MWAIQFTLALVLFLAVGSLGSKALRFIGQATPTEKDGALFKGLSYAWWGVSLFLGLSYLVYTLNLPHEPFRTFGERLLLWLGSKGVSGGVILLFTWLAFQSVPRLLQRLPELEGELTRKQVRAKTLRSVAEAVLKTVVLVVGGLFFLSNLGLNITALLAGAGVAGLALSLATQNLVRDVINGFLILLEDQYGVGDIIQVNGVGGQVERFNLRITVLRDLEGRVHFIPNSQVQQVTVLTQEWSRAVVDVSVAYGENIDRVLEVFQDEANRLYEDPVWQADFLKPPEVLGVQNLADSGVVIRTLLETKPGRQWTVAREFRRRIKNRLDREGIGIPFPHQVVYFGGPLQLKRLD